MHHFNDPEQYFDEYKRTYKCADRGEAIPDGTAKDTNLKKLSGSLRIDHKKKGYSAAGRTYGGNG